MNAFLALVRKDLILYVSDRRALLMHLVLPIVIAAFFGSVFGGSAKSGAIDVALVQQDASEVGRRIGAGLQADPNLHVTLMDRAQAEQAVRKGSQAVAVVLPAGFAEAAGSAMFTPGPKPVIELLYDPSQTAVLAMVKGMLTQQVMSVVSAEMFGGPMGRKLTERSLQQLDAGAIADPALRDMLAAVRTFQAQPQQTGSGSSSAPRGLSMPFTTRDQGLSNAPALQGYNPYAHAFSGMGVQFIMFMGMNMGIAMLAARRDGIWNRLLAAPVSLALVVLARAVSATIIAFCLLCVVFAVAVLAFGVTVSSVPGFLGVALCFGALTAGFGLLVAAFGKTPEAARGIAMFATLIMVMLGGAWVPTFVFPAWVQQATMIVPTRWAITGLDAVTWRGLGLPEAIPAMAALLGFAALFMALAIWRFQKART